MEREYEYLLHLMGAYLREKEPRTLPDVDWKRLLQLAHIHSVSGILGYMAMSYDLCEDEKMATALREICMSTIAGFAHRTALADLFLEQLTEIGIDHVTMKGHVLKDYYPVPELRTYGDIDIVIRPEDRQKCHRWMLSQGYQVKTDWEPVYSYRKTSEYYEIHTELLEVDISEKTGYQDYFRNIWQNAEPVGVHQYRLRPEFHFLYMLVHLAKHLTGSGAGIRMYLDVAVYIHRFDAEVDWQWVRTELETLSLTDFANTVFSFIQRYFGIGSPIPLDPVEDAVLESLAEYTVSGGIFGQDGLDSGKNTLKAEKESVPRCAVILKRMFPAAKTIESRYTYLQKHSWLLPAAWIHRLVKTKDTWGVHAEEARNILAADAEEVQKLRKLYEEIGL